MTFNNRFVLKMGPVYRKYNFINLAKVLGT